ncbi:2OG-Fe(II) oxygenase [Spongiibacter nanhainus]|uniref:2OG-Fe(II) oxygenase n=1 Tax=Spongiibacter nanhainus TaxID=2794344 RepID=A0A7T4R0E0_9GAMM|nr:2OG-Fe(II) oxygenase [Spongiibacter nanhainus]
MYEGLPVSAEIAASSVELPLFDVIADGLTGRGFVVLPLALPPALSEALLLRVTSLGDEAFRRAGVGRERDFQLNRFVRSDEIRWLGSADPAEAQYLAWMEQLRQAINRRLFMGLFDYEAHFARYLPGAFYKKHIDAFKGRSNRVLSTVFYLNGGWQEADGGQLLIYGDDDSVVSKVTPLMGTLVVFLSDSVPHEVLAAQRTRYSIAGWFRVNGSINAQIDPPR